MKVYVLNKSFGHSSRMASRGAVVIYTAANVNLSNDICQYIVRQVDFKGKFEFPKMDITYFQNGETKVKISDSVREKHVFIISTGSSNGGRTLNDHLVATLIAISTCKIADAHSITAVLPCFPYARQDKKHGSREPITASLVCQLLKTAGATRIMSMDLHSDQIQGMIDIPFDNLYAENYMISALVSYYPEIRECKSKWMAVAPDAGALKRVEHFAEKLDLDVAFLQKKRDYNTPNRILQSKLRADNENGVSGKNVIIIDDMADTCGTLEKAAETLHKNGAKRIIVAVTHGILSGDAIEKINKCEYIERMFVSDTIVNQTLCGKFIRYFVGGLIGQAIIEIYSGGSISRLLN